jgi:hypothetical protein
MTFFELADGIVDHIFPSTGSMYKINTVLWKGWLRYLKSKIIPKSCGSCREAYVYFERVKHVKMSSIIKLQKLFGHFYDKIDDSAREAATLRKLKLTAHIVEQAVVCSVGSDSKSLFSDVSPAERDENMNGVTVGVKKPPDKGSSDFVCLAPSRCSRFDLVNDRHEGHAMLCAGKEKKPPDKVAACNPGVSVDKVPPDKSYDTRFGSVGTDDGRLIVKRAKKPPDKVEVLLGKVESSLRSCILSPADAIVAGAYVDLTTPSRGFDDSRFKKKKRRRKKKKGLLSRKNFVYDRGRNTWTLVGEYLSPPLAPPVISRAKRKKKKGEDDVAGIHLDDKCIKWTIVNRVKLNLKCVKLNLKCSELREAPVVCKLGRVKELIKRPGQAKNVHLSVNDVVDLFVHISDAWDVFKEVFCCSLASVVNQPPERVPSECLPVLEASSSLLSVTQSCCLRPGRGRAGCV